jgi:hypothetical protein
MNCIPNPSHRIIARIHHERKVVPATGEQNRIEPPQRLLCTCFGSRYTSLVVSEIHLSNSLYRQATLAAQANHVTLDEFVAQAVEQHLDELGDTLSTAFFTPERLVEIQVAQTEARTGNNLSLDQYRAASLARRSEWEANRPA